MTSLEMNRRRFIELGGLAALTTALAACAPTGGTVAGSKVDITFWNYFASPTEREGMQKVLNRFAAVNSGVGVTPEGIPLADYMPKIVAAVQANRLPASGQIMVGTLPDMIELGAVQDITKRVNAWDGRDGVRSRLWDEVTRDGVVYGVPSFTFVGWLYCRQDWMDEAGVTPPTTWEEFEEVAIALTDPSRGRYGFGMRGGAGGGNDLMNYLESYGVKFVDADGKLVLDEGILAKGLDFFSGLHLRHKAVPPSVASDSFQQLMTGFKTGVTGMLGHHTGSLVEISAVLKPLEQVITTPVPDGPGGAGGRYFGQHNAIFTSNEAEADAAWSWISHWGSDLDSQIDFMLSCGQFPVLTAAGEAKAVADNPMYATAAKVLETAPKATVFQGMNAFQANHLLPAFQQILTGQATPDQAAKLVVSGLEQEAS